MDHDDDRTRLLDAAESLFYDRGIQAVGMDELRASAGLSLKRVYRLYAAKQDLVEAYLARRDRRWRAELARHVEEHGGSPTDRLLSVFDWLRDWFRGPGFRGCAFINSYGELGGGSAAVADAARRHKRAVARYLTGLARATDAADPDALARQLVILVDGATTTAAIGGTARAATDARAAAATLIAAATA